MIEERDDDGVYVSSAGYRVRRRYETNGAGGTQWLTERPDNEPLPGWNVSSTLDYAKQHAQRDWQERLRAEPEL